MASLAIALWAAVAIGLGLAIYGHFVEPLRIRVRLQTVEIADLPEALDGLTIAHLSDLHCSDDPVSTRLAREAVRLAAECDPDLALVTGDLAHGSRNMERALEALVGLNARYGAFAVLGNHDVNWTVSNIVAQPDLLNDSWPGWVEGFSGLRTVLLENDCRSVAINGCRVAIAGLGDVCSRRDDAELAFEGGAAGDLRILLDHTPDVLDTVAADWAHLVLCGHTHGGQWRLPWVGTLWAPVWRDWRRAFGLFDCEGILCHVTRGVGSAFRMRINCAPEVALLTLRRGPSRARRLRRYRRGGDCRPEAQTSRGSG